MNILFLTNLLPYPMDNGGKIKTYTTLQALHNGGHNVDLVCFKENAQENEEFNKQILKLCRSVKQVELKLTTAENKMYMIATAFKSLFSRYSFGVYKYRSKEMNNILTELLYSNKYDIIYYDHLQLCVYKKLVDKLNKDAMSILDEHNCEALIMKRNADTTNNFIKKVFLKLEAHKLYKFEKKNILAADKRIILSNEDYMALSEMCNADFGHAIIPIGVQDNGIKKSALCDNQHIDILFLGTLTWEPNNNGAIWFVKKVVPLLKEAGVDFTLYIAGKGPSDELKKVAMDYDNVKITGYVESVDEYYDMCQCMVVPLFFGSGQRVKIIEAFSKGMPVISTTIGAEGLECVHEKNCLIADDEEAFKNMIMTMINNNTLRESLGVEARKIYEQNYSPMAIESKILDTLKK